MLQPGRRIRRTYSLVELTLNNKQFDENDPLSLANNNTVSCPSEHVRNTCFDVESKIRLELRWFLSGPLEKYKALKRRPWKLFIQLLKIVLITIQIVYFSQTEIKNISMKNDLTDLSTNLFLMDKFDAPKSQQIFIYTKSDLVDQLTFTYNQFLNIENVSFSIFDQTKDNSFKICHLYIDGNQTLLLEKMLFKDNVISNNNYQHCYNIKNKTQFDNYLKLLEIPKSLTEISMIKTTFFLFAEAYTENKMSKNLLCFLTTIHITYDNIYNNGQIQVTIDPNHIQSQCDHTDKVSESRLIISFVILNIVVMIVVFISMILCFRSFFSHYRLMKRVNHYFMTNRGQKLTFYDNLLFVNWWIILIFLSDASAFIGTVLKILVEVIDIKLSTSVIILLSFACITVWIGSLRYLTFFDSYNALLIITRLSFPTLFRFSVCVGFLFMGFTFLGYITLGPYHPKFNTLATSSECLFSLMNGDEIFITFQMVETNSNFLHIFSQVYLALFNLVFIYLIVTIFVAIVCHYYEHQINGKHLTESNSTLMKFINMCKCENCDIQAIYAIGQQKRISEQNQRYNKPSNSSYTHNCNRNSFSTISFSKARSILSELDFNVKDELG